MRYDRYLYKEWMINHFPFLASLPIKFYEGAPLNASFINRFIYMQLGRIRKNITKSTKQLNYINFYKYRKDIIDYESLRSNIGRLLPYDFENLIFSNDKYYLLLYNLKCLEIIKENFNAIFTNS
jgi:hypothetical protein